MTDNRHHARRTKRLRPPRAAALPRPPFLDPELSATSLCERPSSSSRSSIHQIVRYERLRHGLGKIANGGNTRLTEVGNEFASDPFSAVSSPLASSEAPSATAFDPPREIQYQWLRQSTESCGQTSRQWPRPPLPCRSPAQRARPCCLRTRCDHRGRSVVEFGKDKGRVPITHSGYAQPEMGTNARACLSPHPEPTVAVAVPATMVGPGSVGIGPVAVLCHGGRRRISSSRANLSGDIYSLRMRLTTEGGWRPDV